MLNLSHSLSLALHIFSPFAAERCSFHSTVLDIFFLIVHKKENIYLNFRAIDRQNIALLVVRSSAGFFLTPYYIASMLCMCLCGEKKKIYECGRHHQQQNAFGIRRKSKSV